MHERTTAIVATFIKSRWTPLQTSQKQLRWFTSPLSADPTSTDDISTYADLETNSVHISIDIQDNNTGFISPALQGQTFPAAKALLILGTLATQYAHATSERDLNSNKLDRVARALSFPEIRKPSTTSSTITAFCKNASDAFTLIAIKNILIPQGDTSMLLSFSPTKDPTARALMSPAIASAVLNHKEFFFQGGLPICITSTIFLPTDTFFNLVLLTLTSYQQLSQASTNMGSEDGAT
jgi:hypothetical protein